MPMRRRYAALINDEIGEVSVAELLWFVAVAIGPVILAIVIAYALIRRRRLSAREREVQKEATERLYRGESK